LPIRGAATLRDKLIANADQLRLSRELAVLETAIAELQPPPVFAPGASNISAVIEYLAELGISGPLLRRWDALAGEPACA